MVEKTFRCDICDGEYATIQEISAHMARSHRALGEVHQLIANYSSRIGHSRSSLATGTVRSNEQISSEGNDSEDTPFNPHSTVNSTNPQFPMSSVEYSEIPIAPDVASFFKSFNDSSTEVHEDLRPPFPPLSNLNSSCRSLIAFATRQKQTKSEIHALWCLVAELEREIPAPFRHVSNAFQSGRAMSTYVEHARKWHVKTSGWRSAIIKSPLGKNTTGVFRSVLDILFSQLDDAGGLSSIIQFAKVFQNQSRVFDGPCSSRAMEKYDAECRQGAYLVGFDIYADGTTLARSGSQSATILRVRFTNIRGKSGKWHEVGISPRLICDTDERTKSEKTNERQHLAQRFLFIALEDIIKASASGVMYKGKLIFPRVLCTVADQPQERQFFGLKSSGSFRDCSCCTMKSSAEKTNRSVNLNPTSGLCSEGDASRCQSDSDLTESILCDEAGTSNSDNLAHVRQTQLSGNRQCARNVSYALRCQLLVARSRQNIGRRRSRDMEIELRKARAYLKAYSALEFPPALAAFHGLGTKPFLLYSSIGFDKLHVVDLGVLRSIPDLAFKRLSSAPYLTMPVSQQIKVINQRLLDLPKAARLPRISLFRYSANQMQPGMSGGIRRQFAPFIWVALMGISESVVPDDDPLLQASLSLATAAKQIRGSNEGPLSTRRTGDDIEDIQLLCYDAGVALARALGVKVSTKIHRLMYHVADHLYNFGCMQWGSTDDNEVLHKDTKAAYHATNAKPSQLSLQLLAGRAELFALEERDKSDVPSQANTFETPENTIQEIMRERFRFAVLKVHSCTTVESAENAILSSRHASTHDLLWRKFRDITIIPRFEWWPEFAQCSQIIYAGENIYGQHVRQDSVLYKRNSTSEPMFGIIQCFFQHTLHPNLKVALVRVLEETCPDLGNTKVVYNHGNKRLKYKINESGDVQMDLILVQDIQRLAMLVPDTYNISVHYGLRTRINNLPDNIQDRQIARFFEVSAFQFTSLPQWKGRTENRDI